MKRYRCSRSSGIGVHVALEYAVVAEGVEIREQLTLLEELGCDYAQGYYFSKPLTAKQLLELKYTTKP
jgi:EAL domain-containing protein (putative c-di-GMP-specific phosphodiesterase class I)